VLLARREERLRELAQEIGGEYELCDVAERASVERAAAAVTARHPAVSLLVNNAGIPGRGGFLEVDPDRIERVVRVNYLGSVWCVRSFLPALEAAKPSDLVNIVSVAGTVAWGPSGPYTAAKHAQLALSRSLAAELRQRGVRVHTVNPAFVETEGFPQRTTLSHGFLRRSVVEPEDVAEHVVHVLDRDRTETFFPAYYRIPAIVQALAPGLLARVLSRPSIAASGRRREAPERPT
jgi:short-subunit dehydrogenase